MNGKDCIKYRLFMMLTDTVSDNADDMHNL